MTDEDLEQLRDDVVSIAKSLEEKYEDWDAEDYDEFMQGILDFELTVNLDGDVREVVAIWTTGGPHIELNLTKGRVDGYWSGNEWSTHCNADIFDAVEDSIVDQFEASRSHR